MGLELWLYLLCLYTYLLGPTIPVLTRAHHPSSDPSKEAAFGWPMSVASSQARLDLVGVRVRARVRVRATRRGLHAAQLDGPQLTLDPLTPTLTLTLALALTPTLTP